MCPGGGWQYRASPCPSARPACADRYAGGGARDLGCRGCFAPRARRTIAYLRPDGTRRAHLHAPLAAMPPLPGTHRLRHARTGEAPGQARPCENHFARRTLRVDLPPRTNPPGTADRLPLAWTVEAAAPHRAEGRADSYRHVS